MGGAAQRANPSLGCYFPHSLWPRGPGIFFSLPRELELAALGALPF